MHISTKINKFTTVIDDNSKVDCLLAMLPYLPKKVQISQQKDKTLFCLVYTIPW